MSEGHYASHIRRMRSVYGARHDALIFAIRHHFGDQLPVIGGDAGLHLVVGLPAHVDDRAVVEQIGHVRIMARPLSLYHMQQPAAAKGLLLGYGAVSEEDIAAHFARLAHVVQRFL
jgi:GntR family transcriptional regulator/MocR family aminotransferase